MVVVQLPPAQQLQMAPAVLHRRPTRHWKRGAWPPEPPEPSSATLDVLQSMLQKRLLTRNLGERALSMGCEDQCNRMSQKWGISDGSLDGTIAEATVTNPALLVQVLALNLSKAWLWA